MTVLQEDLMLSRQIQKWRSINSFDFVNSTESIKPQYAVQRLYELTKNKIPI
jgi:acetolactate synthase-1/2/3 large subunit